MPLHDLGREFSYKHLLTFHYALQMIGELMAIIGSSMGQKLFLGVSSLRKVHFCCVLANKHSKEFKRQAFFLLNGREPQKAVLIHYLGDENIAVNFQHGNCKGDNSRDFCRTCPSVLADLTSAQDIPSNIYKNAISKPPKNCPPALQPAYMPRDLRQVKNAQYNERQKSRLTHDAIYNLHELAYDLNGFVKLITTYPDLVVICGLDKLIEELDLILQMDSERPQLLSYDTTFQLGDFYLSPLLYRHTLFSNSPVMPALFLIHERKFQSTHETFMQNLAKLVPTLVRGRRNVPFVTDEETGIKNVSKLEKLCSHFPSLCTFQAIEKHLPRVIWLRCWNHTINAIKLWLRKHCASSGVHQSCEGSAEPGQYFGI